MLENSSLALSLSAALQKTGVYTRILNRELCSLLFMPQKTELECYAVIIEPYYRSEVLLFCAKVSQMAENTHHSAMYVNYCEFL